MGEALGTSVVVFVLFVAAFGLGQLIRAIRNRGDLRALPDPAERAELLQRVRDMRASGESFEACMVFLRGRGLRKGVAQGLIIDVESEVPADVEHPRDGAWRSWRFRYPGNWKVAPVIPELGADHGVSIEGTGSAMVLLVRLTEDMDFGELEREQAQQVRDPERRSIAAWGSLAGEGTVYTGEHARVRVPFEITVFRPRDVPEDFAVVQLHALEEAALVTGGLQLVQQTFARA